MTLLDIFPSLRAVMTPRLDPSLWPVTTSHDAQGRLCVGGTALTDIADRYGTPTYVLDEADVRHRCRTYRDVFPDAEIAYAGKAMMIRATARWVTEEGLSVDVCSAGELAIALSAHVDPARIIMHGNAKSSTELRAAVSAGVGRIVVDSHTEIALLGAVLDHRQNVLIRVTPGIDVHGDRSVATGVVDQKFGFPIFTDQLDATIKMVLGQRRLNLLGLHCHLGSQIIEPAHFRIAVDRMIAQMAQVRRDHGVILTELNLGGGHGIAYAPDDPQLDLTFLAREIDDALDDSCARNRFPRPRIVLEPGRSVVARAGVTLYRVQSVKRIDGARTFVSVDGGMSDNPRVAQHGSHTVALANRHSASSLQEVTVVGRHCEAGDEIAVGVALPEDLHPGDVLAIPCTGAYHSMASTYHSVGRPPIVAVRDGSARTLVRRESVDDLMGREVGV